MKSALLLLLLPLLIQADNISGRSKKNHRSAYHEEAYYEQYEPAMYEEAHSEAGYWVPDPAYAHQYYPQFEPEGYEAEHDVAGFWVPEDRYYELEDAGYHGEALSYAIEELAEYEETYY